MDVHVEAPLISDQQHITNLQKVYNGENASSAEKSLVEKPEENAVPMNENAKQDEKSDVHVNKNVNIQAEGGLESRREAWETGDIDYLGVDRFENIMKKLNESMACSPSYTVQLPL